MRFRYTLKDKAAFYWNYFTSKVFCLWFEVKKPRLKMFIYEMLYSAVKLINYNYLMPSPFNTDYVETRFGRFRIRPKTVDMTNVSPAFERKDMDYLLKLLSRLKSENKKILFFDVGADLGTYSITVGNAFKDYGHMHIMAFEPSPSYGLLGENIRLNGLEGGKVTAYNFALYSEDNKELEFNFNPDAPGSSGIASGGAHKVIARTLDSVLGDKLKDYDAFVFKLDVEGVESEVLKGAHKILKSGKEIHLLIEDFINPAIISYLEGIGAEFIIKLTPYNSFWRV